MWEESEPLEKGLMVEGQELEVNQGYLTLEGDIGNFGKLAARRTAGNQNLLSLFTGRKKERERNMCICGNASGIFWLLMLMFKLA